MKTRKCQKRDKSLKTRLLSICIIKTHIKDPGIPRFCNLKFLNNATNCREDPQLRVPRSGTVSINHPEIGIILRYDAEISPLGMFQGERRLRIEKREKYRGWSGVREGGVGKYQRPGENARINNIRSLIHHRAKYRHHH